MILEAIYYLYSRCIYVNKREHHTSTYQLVRQYYEVFHWLIVRTVFQHWCCTDWLAPKNSSMFWRHSPARHKFPENLWSTSCIQEFCKRIEHYALFTTSVNVNTEDFYERFCTDTMSSFPRNDMLMYIFLADFQKKKPDIYETDMSKRVSSSTTISCDHTFKSSKCIGARRASDAKFVKQFENLFIWTRNVKLLYAG